MPLFWEFRSYNIISLATIASSSNHICNLSLESSVLTCGVLVQVLSSFKEVTLAIQYRLEFGLEFERNGFENVKSSTKVLLNLLDTIK